MAHRLTARTEAIIEREAARIRAELIPWKQGLQGKRVPRFRRARRCLQTGQPLLSFEQVISQSM